MNRHPERNPGGPGIPAPVVRAPRVWRQVSLKVIIEGRSYFFDDDGWLLDASNSELRSPQWLPLIEPNPAQHFLCPEDEEILLDSGHPDPREMTTPLENHGRETFENALRMLGEILDQARYNNPMNFIPQVMQSHPIQPMYPMFHPPIIPPFDQFINLRNPQPYSHNNQFYPNNFFGYRYADNNSFIHRFRPPLNFNVQMVQNGNLQVPTLYSGHYPAQLNATVPGTLNLPEGFENNENLGMNEPNEEEQSVANDSSDSESPQPNESGDIVEGQSIRSREPRELGPMRRSRRRVQERPYGLSHRSNTLHAHGSRPDQSPDPQGEMNDLIGDPRRQTPSIIFRRIRIQPTTQERFHDNAQWIRHS